MDTTFRYMHPRAAVRGLIDLAKRHLASIPLTREQESAVIHLEDAEYHAVHVDSDSLERAAAHSVVAATHALEALRLTVGDYHPDSVIAAFCVEGMKPKA